MTQLTFSNEKELLMFFQTTLRNVGLTTTISFASLAYSRFYRGKSLLYSTGLVLISLLLIMISFTINLFLLNTMKEYQNLKDFKNTQKWINFNYGFLTIHIILFTILSCTLYRVVFKKTF
tara:strand:+ start:813 stop:1172 length:360 start_codon:yes stop_codon:yes gene_type:complete